MSSQWECGRPMLTVLATILLYQQKESRASWKSVGTSRKNATFRQPGCIETVLVQHTQCYLAACLQGLAKCKNFTTLWAILQSKSVGSSRPTTIYLLTKDCLTLTLEILKFPPRPF